MKTVKEEASLTSERRKLQVVVLDSLMLIILHGNDQHDEATDALVFTRVCIDPSRIRQLSEIRHC